MNLNKPDIALTIMLGGNAKRVINKGALISIVNKKSKDGSAIVRRGSVL